MRAERDARALLTEGLRSIREEFGLVDRFPAAVAREADEAAAAGPRPTDREDLTGLPMVTLDPAASRDLDQAFALDRDGAAVVLHYAIVDVGAWVPVGGAIEGEAWRRGSTIYALDGRVPLHPPVLSEGAASLLPDGDRPAVVLDVTVDPDGDTTLRAVRRAVVRSRAKLAYETIGDADLDPLVVELAGRIAVADERRGASRVDVAEQEVALDPSSPSGVTLRVAPRAPAEDRNAAMSLAANLAVARTMLAAGAGLFRTMAEPDRRQLAALHRTAEALGIDWPDGVTLRQLYARLDQRNPRHVAFLLAARRSGRGATYTTYRTGDPTPWHAAIAAPYAHATAPLRRLADRYVLDHVCAIAAGEPTPDVTVFDRLVAVMERSETVAARVDRATVDLVEALVLRGREGEVFAAVVIESDDHTSSVQLTDPPVRARLRLGDGEPGRRLRLRLVTADPRRRRVEFAEA